jgi:hypothetical protein
LSAKRDLVQAGQIEAPQPARLLAVDERHHFAGDGRSP